MGKWVTVPTGTATPHPWDTCATFLFFFFFLGCPDRTVTRIANARSPNNRQRMIVDSEIKVRTYRAPSSSVSNASYIKKGLAFCVDNMFGCYLSWERISTINNNSCARPIQ
jgi:hypothetical protein